MNDEQRTQHMKECYLFNELMEHGYKTFTVRDKDGSFRSITFMNTLFNKITHCPHCGIEFEYDMEA
jgi:hypothetical protein